MSQGHQQKEEESLYRNIPDPPQDIVEEKTVLPISKHNIL